MQNQKPLSTRVLSLALTAAMVATMMPQAVFAEGTAPIDASGVTTTRTITAVGELGEGFSKSVPFDGHTYVLDVKANTPFENVKLPTELSVTVEKTTTNATPPSNDEVANLGEATSTAPVEKPVEPAVETPVADEATNTEPSTTTDTDITVLDAEPATPSGAEPAPVEKPGNTTVIETTQENVPVTWNGDKEYTAAPNSNVVYTAVLPEGYALKYGVVLPIINVKVGKKVMTPMSAKPRAGANIATGISGTCSWVIDAAGEFTISPTDNTSGILASYDSSTSVPWNIHAAEITSVVVKPGVATGTSAAYLFADFTCCTNINLSALDTSAATNMCEMFARCNVLPSLDLSLFNTDKVTDMSKMFYKCKTLTSLTLSSKFDTSKVTNMQDMFSRCETFTSLDLSLFNTAMVTNMQDMFDRCTALTTLTLSSKFDTTNVTTMYNMFYNCGALTSLDLSSFVNTNVTNMNSMFSGCTALISLNLSGFNTTNVTDMNSMFSDCTALTSLNLSGFNTANVTDMNSMFSGCTALTSLDVSKFDTAKATDIRSMFGNCEALKSLDLSSFNTSAITIEITGLFESCNSIESIQFGANFNKAVPLPLLALTGKVFEGWYTNAEGTGTPVIDQNGGSYTTPANTTVYTKWISFDPTIAVAVQNGTASYGTAASPTFVVASNNFGGKYPDFAPTVVWTSGNAPTGVTPAFSPDNATLTVTTTAETKAGDYTFKVVSPKKSPETGNYESAVATLTVGKREVTIAWDTNTSFVYDGTSHKPTATVSNAVNGDVLTVTVTGEQANVGNNHIATASALAGTAAGNYKLPTTATTTTFAITAKTVTAIDGNLEVKKAYDGKTTAGTVTGGKLGLTDVLDADKTNVLVSVDKVGDYADANIGTGKTVTLTISLEGTVANNYTLSNSSYSFSKAEITKKAYAGTQATAPNATNSTKTDTTVTLNVQAIDGETVEYGYSDSASGTIIWQDSTVFTTLAANTNYYFFARVKENDTHAAGTTSADTLIKTDKVDYTGAQATAPEKVPASKTKTNITLKTVTLPTGEPVEYGIDKNGTIEWQLTPAFDGLTVGTEYKFYTRVKESDTHKAGTTSAETKISTQKADTTVGGKVTLNGNALDGATVTLKQGGKVINTDTTKANGDYSFANVPEGVYSLVITNGTVPNIVTITETIAADGSPITKNILFPDGKKNTVVESKPGTPEVAVGGLNDLLTGTKLNETLNKPEEQAAVAKGGSVELKFTANVKPLSEGTADKNAIETEVAGSQKIDWLLDLSLTKTVKDDKNTIIANDVPIHKLAKIITVHLPIKEELQGKSGLSLYRMHEGVAEKLSTTADVNGEHYEIDPSGTFMTLYLMKFSTYAMGYDAFTAKIIDGGTGASGNGNYSNGDTVTINAGSKSGYAFSGWTVTTGGVNLADPKSATITFVMPAEAVTVTANWTSTGGGTGGNPAPQVYYYINATTSRGGSINTPERVKVIAGGSASFTITPDKGYQIADVLVNGNSIGAKNSYVFTNVNSDQTIHATFKKAGHRNPQTGVDVEDAVDATIDLGNANETVNTDTQGGISTGIMVTIVIAAILAIAIVAVGVVAIAKKRKE